MTLDIVIRTWYNVETRRDRIVVENALIAAALKGSAGSGNWGHTSHTRTGKIGGSDPGGGLTAVGAPPASTPQERHTASAQTRQARRGMAAVPRFKSNREAADWIVAQGLAKECFFKGLDVRMCQDMADSLYDNAQRIPALKGAVDRIGNNRELNAKLRKEREPGIRLVAEQFFPKKADEDLREKYIKGRLRALGYRMPPNSYAMAVGRQFYISQKWGSDYDALRASLTEGVKSGWHPRGTATGRSIVDHELAHIMEEILPIHIDREITAIRQTAYKAKTVPSQYARRNRSEFFAESWAEWVNSPNPGDVAAGIGRQTEELARELLW